jgi:hypothetical protein
MKKISFLLLVIFAAFSVLSASDSSMYRPTPSANVPAKGPFFSHRGRDKKLAMTRRINRYKRVRQAASQSADKKSIRDGEKTPGTR